jgi:hypothetical protein
MLKKSQKNYQAYLALSKTLNGIDSSELVAKRVAKLKTIAKA